MVAINQKKLNQFLASDRVSFKGVEKENLRSDKDGRISNKSFPEAFGVHNFNSFVTLDYSQPHLEIVTPTFQDNYELYGFLEGLHAYVEQNLEGDLLWNYSMPPKFKGKFIKLPPYGKSNKTKLAHLYRLGLRNRYGDKMQSTAGIHFNISFSESVIKELNTTKTDLYLGICRNFLRVFPLVLRLIGCSPVAHRSFIKDRELSIDLLKEDENYLPKSTSLRVSRLGYYSEEQDEKFITFNTLGEYLNLIKDYINIPNKKFSEISLDLKKQVNNGTIQMENELYNHIRPKGLFSTNARQYNQLKNDGIEYLEIRSIDLNPFTDIGISKLDLETINRSMRVSIASDEEIMNKHLPFLANVGSVSPYVGLLGTVWGIMTSFIGLSDATQATINAVAPGISEALVATALGLFAAIPAVIAFNRFTSKADSYLQTTTIFAEELASIFYRESVKQKDDL